MSRIKIIVCILIGVLIFVTTAACGSQSDNTPNASTPADGTEATAPASSDTAPTDPASTVPAADPFGKYTPAITLSTVRIADATVKFEPGNPNRESLEKNIWATAYEEQLGVKFNYLWTTDGSQYNSKWNVSIASEDIPDCAVVDANTYAMLLRGGLVEDMTDIYDQYASEENKNCNVLDKGIVMKATSQNGRLMGLPHSGQLFEATGMLFIRGDWLDKLGLPEPKTIDELINTAKAFKDAKLGGPQTYGIAMNKVILTGLNDSVGFYNGFGAYYKFWLKDSNGQLIYSNIQPAWRDALLKLQSLYKDELIKQDFAVSDWTKAGEDIASGKVGIAYGSYPMPIISIQANTQNDPNASWKVLPIVTTDGSTPKPQSMMSTVSNYVFVKKGCEHPEAVVKVMNLNLKLYEDPAYGTLDGYEQHKYRFACDYLKPLELLTMHNQICEALKNGDTSKMNPTTAANFESVKKGLDGDKSNNFWMVLGPEPNSTFTIVNQNYKTNSYVTNQFLGLPTETMLAKINTLDADLEAAMFNVIMGDDISVFDKAVSNWKSMGGDQITKEVNDWYAANK